MIRMTSSAKPIAHYASSTVSVKLEDGTIITGDPVKVLELVRLRQPVPMYESSSKGQVPICTMETKHLRNAILRRVNGWMCILRDLTDSSLSEELKNPYTMDEELKNLVAEYTNRFTTKSI